MNTLNNVYVCACVPEYKILRFLPHTSHTHAHAHALTIPLLLLRLHVCMQAFSPVELERLIERANHVSWLLQGRKAINVALKWQQCNSVSGGVSPWDNYAYWRVPSPMGVTLQHIQRASNMWRGFM